MKYKTASLRDWLKSSVPNYNLDKDLWERTFERFGEEFAESQIPSSGNIGYLIHNWIDEHGWKECLIEELELIKKEPGDHPTFSRSFSQQARLYLQIIKSPNPYIGKRLILAEWDAYKFHIYHPIQPLLDRWACERFQELLKDQAETTKALKQNTKEFLSKQIQLLRRTITE